MPEQRIKVLLSKLGLDVHNRGIITVSKQLRDAGMEVIYIGNAMPAAIINIAIQEAADIIGISSLGGAHLVLGEEIIREAKKEGIKDKSGFIIGGVFSPQDAIKLKELGFDDVFTPGASKDEIVSSISKINTEKNYKKNMAIE